MTDPGALYREGLEAFRRGDAAASRELNERSLALAREQDDAPAVVDALIGLARVALRESDFERVHALAREGRALAQERGLTESLVLPLHLDAEATRMEGDLEAARRLYEESIALNRRLGDARMVAVEKQNLSWVEINAGNLDAAEELLRTSLGATSEQDVYGHAFVLVGLGRIAAERGRAEQAAKLLAEGAQKLAAGGLVLDPADKPEFEQSVALVERLEPGAYERARAAAGVRP
jgi:tetratricopeptide (TPR) repeat protein